MSDPAFTLRIKLSNRRPVVVPPARRRTASMQERIARKEAIDWNRSCASVTITAYDDLVPGWDSAGRVRLTCEVKHGSVVVFPKGQLTCALHAASDGIQAKELVMSLVAMHPSHARYRQDFLDQGYTPEQLAWVEAHGEALDGEREARYCNPEDGSVRKVE